MGGRSWHPSVRQEGDWADWLQRQRFDYLFSVANLAMLPPSLLHAARLGAINFHDGPLPRFAGLNATSWALLSGATSHGITWHEMADRRTLAESCVSASSTWRLTRPRGH